jgi:hypothetical protein
MEQSPPYVEGGRELPLRAEKLEVGVLVVHYRVVWGS